MILYWNSSNCSALLFLHVTSKTVASAALLNCIVWPPVRKIETYSTIFTHKPLHELCYCFEEMFSIWPSTKMINTAQQYDTNKTLRSSSKRNEAFWPFGFRFKIKEWKLSNTCLWDIYTGMQIHCKCIFVRSLMLRLKHIFCCSNLTSRISFFSQQIN